MPITTYNQDINKRLDKYLAEKYYFFSRRYFQEKIKLGKILVNNQKKSSGYKLKKGDKIIVNLSLKKPTVVTKLPPTKKVFFEIVAKYPDFLIISKPAELTVHPSRFDIENNSIPPTLAGGLITKFPELQKIGEDFTRPAIVHRLDKDTSGLMIIPRTQEAFLKFKKLFQKHQIKKTYLALCYNLQKENNPPKENKKYKTIDTLIGKSKRDHTKQATSKNPDYLINPKNAITKYKTLKHHQLPCTYKIGKRKKQFIPIVLIETKPKTGRKHQIRVHLNSIGLPLIGDCHYSRKNLKNCNKLFSHHLLQAHKLQFIYKGKKYSFTAKQPQWLENILSHPNTSK